MLVLCYRTEFANILSTQSEGLEEVHAEGKDASSAVEASSSELQLTIDRSESHGRNVVFVSVGLAVVLLLLDFITP